MADQQESKDKTPLDVAVAELYELSIEQHEVLLAVKNAVENGHFKYLPREHRAAVLEKLLKTADAHHDATRNVVKLLRGVKREHVSNEVLAMYLGFSELGLTIEPKGDAEPDHAE